MTLEDIAVNVRIGQPHQPRRANGSSAPAPNSLAPVASTSSAAPPPAVAPPPPPGVSRERASLLVPEISRRYRGVLADLYATLPSQAKMDWLVSSYVGSLSWFWVGASRSRRLFPSLSSVHSRSHPARSPPRADIPRRVRRVPHAAAGGQAVRGRPAVALGPLPHALPRRQRARLRPARVRLHRRRAHSNGARLLRGRPRRPRLRRRHGRRAPALDPGRHPPRPARAQLGRPGPRRRPPPLRRRQRARRAAAPPRQARVRPGDDAARGPGAPDGQEHAPQGGRPAPLPRAAPPRPGHLPRQPCPAASPRYVLALSSSSCAGPFAS